MDLSSGAAPLLVGAEFTAFLQEDLAIAVGDLGVCTEKAKSEIIAPLLIELRRALCRRFSVFSGMELNVNKVRGLNGACDYILTRGDNQHLREAPIVGVLEAKNEAFSQQGLGQCVAAIVRSPTPQPQVRLARRPCLWGGDHRAGVALPGAGRPDRHPGRGDAPCR
jgi:hypothetical protein